MFLAVTFVIIFLGNVCGLSGKGLLLGVLVPYMKILGFDNFYAPMILIVTSILPPMTFVSKLPIIRLLSITFL